MAGAVITPGNPLSPELVAPVSASPGVLTPAAPEVDADDALVEPDTDRWGKSQHKTM